MSKQLEEAIISIKALEQRLESLRARTAAVAQQLKDHPELESSQPLKVSETLFAIMKDV